ncbi:MAG TPA: hypothetical protein VKR06_02970 [Ktedonosporobacter sp.]|nr:hypothetical protein [Ktedonosporobacter sp.]
MAMNIPDYRITWVHGIGQFTPDYSVPWRTAFNSYLNFPDSDYIEVLWATVFNMLVANKAKLQLTLQEAVTEDVVRKTLATVLLARATALPDAPSGEWSGMIGEEAVDEALLPDWLPGWLPNLEDDIDEFTQYLLNAGIRSAVKAKVKEKLIPLAGSGDDISIIAHSWGTVVAYDSLLDLEVEEPDFQLTNLFTLGSPLWLVKPFLVNSSGRKPRNTADWVNIHTLGDLIGGPLRPAFQVDHDFAVPNFGGPDAHNSYFVDGNVAVQRDIVAATILG